MEGLSLVSLTIARIAAVRRSRLGLINITL